MLTGVNKIADAVQVTLGPKGRNVAIDQPYGTCKITKDGVTVAKSVDLADKVENMGAQLVKKVAAQTNDNAGDGTTTATILARAIFCEGFKAVASGANPVEVQRGINAAASHVREILGKNAKQITDVEVHQVATISANNDAQIGQLIARAMKAVGRDGVITIESGMKLENELSVVKGLQFDRGMINPIFITETSHQKAIFDQPLILVVEEKLSDFEGLLELLDEARSRGRALVIIADDVEGGALNTLILNRLKTGLKCCAIKAPGFGDNRAKLMEDIAVATGANFVSKNSGLTLKELTVDDLGSCRKMEITMSETLILEGEGNREKISERVDQIRAQMDDASKYEREKLAERLAKLSDGVALIKIGGGSEVEVNEKKDRVTDALNATRAAVEEGIVPGGGVALLYASNALKTLEGENADQKVGVELVRKALRVPARVICDNAGLEGSVITGRLLEESFGATSSNKGLNALTGEFVDMTEAGIIDPVKVVRSALSDSSSISGVMITTEAVISAEPSDEKAPAGFGGMGGAPMY